MVWDELYAPLGLPLPAPAPPRLRLRKAHLAALAPAALALAFSASSLDRREPPPRLEPAPVAKAEPQPAPASQAKSAETEKPGASLPVAAESEAAGGVKVTRGGAPGLPPGGIFINVRDALGAHGRSEEPERMSIPAGLPGR